MRETTDFHLFVSTVSLVRASGLPFEIAEAAVRCALDEYRARAQDIRFRLAAEKLALNPPQPEAPIADTQAQVKDGPKEGRPATGSRKTVAPRA